MEKKTMGGFIAALRKAQGMTQQELADRLRVSNKTISKWECGDSYPEITLIPVIAETFDITIDELFKGGRTADIKCFSREEEEILNTEHITKHINVTKFANISYISVALTLIGFILLFVISYTAYAPITGFGVFMAFFVASTLLQIANSHQRFVLIKRSKESEGEPIRNFYLVTLIVLTINFSGLIFASPFIFIHNYYGAAIFHIEGYLALVPFMSLGCWLAYWIAKKVVEKSRCIDLSRRGIVALVVRITLVAFILLATIFSNIQML